MKRITIHVASRDRHSELGLLLQSLKDQQYKEWDLYILDDASGSPIEGNYFLNCLFTILKEEGHFVKVIRNNISNGVCFARNMLIEADTLENEYTCRLDDDVILESDYLTRLVNVIDSGYDLASGVTPTVLAPPIRRATEFAKPIINECVLDTEGKITKFADDCGYMYTESEILPAHHFRSNCLYKSEINKKIKYEKGLSRVGFREESFFSLRCLWLGYKIGVDTGAIAWHLRTPSGGCRATNYNELVQIDDRQFNLWVKNTFRRKGDPTKQ